MNRKAKQIRVRVEPRLCGSLGLCVREVPEVFYFQTGSKRASAAFEILPRYLVSRTRAAAERCPCDAIQVFEEELESER